VQAEVMEWNALLSFGRQPANGKDAMSAGVNGIIISRSLLDPYSALERSYMSTRITPKGSTWGLGNNPDYGGLLRKAAQSLDPEVENEALRQVHAKIVDNAEWRWIVHDVIPRAITPKVKGFVQAKSWFQALTPVTITQ